MVSRSEVDMTCTIEKNNLDYNGYVFVLPLLHDIWYRVPSLLHWTRLIAILENEIEFRYIITLNAFELLAASGSLPKLDRSACINNMGPSRLFPISTGSKYWLGNTHYTPSLSFLDLLRIWILFKKWYNMQEYAWKNQLKRTMIQAAPAYICGSQMTLPDVASWHDFVQHVQYAQCLTSQ